MYTFITLSTIIAVINISLFAKQTSKLNEISGAFSPIISHYYCLC